MCWTPGKSLKEVKIEAIKKALEYCGGNKGKAANMLGLAYRTVRILVYQNESLHHFKGRVKRRKIDPEEIEFVGEGQL